MIKTFKIHFYCVSKNYYTIGDIITRTSLLKGFSSPRFFIGSYYLKKCSAKLFLLLLFYFFLAKFGLSGGRFFNVFLVFVFKIPPKNRLLRVDGPRFYYSKNLDKKFSALIIPIKSWIFSSALIIIFLREVLIIISPVAEHLIKDKFIPFLDIFGRKNTEKI